MSKYAEKSKKDRRTDERDFSAEANKKKKLKPVEKHKYRLRVADWDDEG